MSDLPDQLINALAGQYDIERELGRGGMAVVYLARDVRHGRSVAIKVIRDDLASSVSSERFLREIDISARLTHPNILALYNSGSAGGALYYVMPYIAGETLRARLDRERQLPIAEAIVIAKQIAAALDYAHAQGVVHRDIKPENILLQGEHVLVADFGLARAIFTASSAPLTQSGVAVGTPAYMSPEQATGDRAVDGRTDVYSLACVLFEMLAGVPPFRAATLQALLAQHATREPPSVSAERASCPPSVDVALRRALSKLPADRYRTAGELMAALSNSSAALADAPTPARRGRRIAVLAGAVLLALAAAGVGLRRFVSRQPLDAERYVVIPFSAEGETSGKTASGVSEAIADALSEWRGISVVDRRRTRETLDARRGGDSLRLPIALRVARELGARNVIWGDVSSAGDSLTVTATAYDALSGAERRTAAAGLSSARAPARLTMRRLVNSLVRDGTELPWRDEGTALRPHLQAWLAYDSGRVAASAWNLNTAAEYFRKAIAADGQHAQGQLWLARILMWSDSAHEHWAGAARRAVELRSALSRGDSLSALALLDLGEARFPQACERYRRSLEQDSTDFAAQFGLGECQFRDHAVIAQRASPSGYVFRASAQRASEAFRRALELAAPSTPAFVYARLGRVLHTETNRLYTGRGPAPASELFGAYPSLVADTLAYIPYPLARITSGASDVTSPSLVAAIERNRSVLRTLYAQWVTASPGSLEAHVAFAKLLETTQELTATPGQPSAIQETRTARRLSADSAQLLQLARDEARLLVKTANWAAAAALADSMLRRTANRGVDESDVLVGLAALRGRLHETAEMLNTLASEPKYRIMTSSGQPVALAPSLQREYSTMLAFAALGACTDSLKRYSRRLDETLESYYADSTSRVRVRTALLRRPLTLSAPCFQESEIANMSADGDRMVMMQQAVTRREFTTVRAHFDTLRVSRRYRPGDVAIDYTFLEGWMFAAMGDTVGAIRHLDRSLHALPTLGSFLLDSPAQSAGLVRAMGLRAQLAQAVGDRETARRWADAVGTLWSGADPELEPYVRRLREIAGK